MPPDSGSSGRNPKTVRPENTAPPGRLVPEGRTVPKFVPRAFAVRRWLLSIFLRTTRPTSSHVRPAFILSSFPSSGALPAVPSNSRFLLWKDRMVGVAHRLYSVRRPVGIVLAGV